MLLLMFFSVILKKMFKHMFFFLSGLFFVFCNVLCCHACKFKLVMGCIHLFSMNMLWFSMKMAWHGLLIIRVC